LLTDSLLIVGVHRDIDRKQCTLDQFASFEIVLALIDSLSARPPMDEELACSYKAVSL
jgi:hypothetical protein